MDVPLYYTLSQCDTVKVENNTMPYIKSLYSCLNRVIGDGYTDDFKQTAKGIKSTNTDRVYLPDQVKIVNFFRFEGNTNPDDNVIMYIIETVDGLKGTFVYSCDNSSEHKASNLFMVESEKVQ